VILGIASVFFGILVRVGGAQERPIECRASDSSRASASRSVRFSGTRAAGSAATTFWPRGRRTTRNRRCGPSRRRSRSRCSWRA